MKRNSWNPFALISKSRLEVVAKQLKKQRQCEDDCAQRLIECRAKSAGLQAEFVALGGQLTPYSVGNTNSVYNVGQPNIEQKTSEHLKNFVVDNSKLTR